MASTVSQKHRDAKVEALCAYLEESLESSVREIMSLDIAFAGLTQRVTLRLVGKGMFTQYAPFSKEIGLTIQLFPPNGEDIEGWGHLHFSTSGTGVEAEIGSIPWKKGAEEIFTVVAPAITTFPGQPRVHATTFTVKLKIVTLPHKSRAKVR